MQLQRKMFAEGGEKVREEWKSIIDKQLEMNKEIAKNFLGHGVIPFMGSERRNHYCCGETP